MPNRIFIRNAGFSDLPVVAGLARDIWPVCYKGIISESQISFMLETIYSQPAMERQLLDGQKFILLYADTIPAGFASFTINKNEATGKINKLYILPGLQQKGLGKKLIEEAEKAIAKAGCRQIVLNVNRQNKAVRFYETCGYSILREEDISIGPYWMNDFIMVKTLARAPEAG